MAEDSGFLKTLLIVWVFCFCYACSTSSKLQRRTPTDDDNKVIVKKVSEKILKVYSDTSTTIWQSFAPFLIPINMSNDYYTLQIWQAI